MRCEIRHIVMVLLVMAALFGLYSPAPAAAAGASPEAAYMEGQIIVKFKEGLSSPRREGVRASLGAASIREFKRPRISVMKLPPSVSVREAIEALSGNPDIEYAEPNYILRAFATPDDPAFGNLWGLDNNGQTVNGHTGISDADIDAPEAWDTTAGSELVTVAVLDSGIDYLHPDLADNIWINDAEAAGTAGVDDDANGYVDDVYGWDFFSEDSDPMDDDGHGTHVAGIIAARGNNATGITGVSWNAKIMALKFLDVSGLGTTADAIEAIQYAEAKGAAVMNCSFGGEGFSQAFKDAVDASTALFVCAAGNEGANNDQTPSYPASFESGNVLAVAATNQSDELAPFSNYGATSVHLAAPGSNILSTYTLPRATLFYDDFSDGDISDWTTFGSAWTIEGGMLSDGIGDYLSNTDAWAMHELPLAGMLGCSLGYSLELSTERNVDFLHVEYSLDQSLWSALESHTGTFALSAYSLSLPYSGSGPLYIRFRLTSDASVNADGAHIGYVVAYCAANGYDGASEYKYFSGTSMSTPYVSGVAALIEAWNPALSATEARGLILNAVDYLGSLSGLVSSGGRLNAANVFFPAPGGLAAQAVSKTEIVLSWTDNSAIESEFAIERKTSATGFVEVARVGAGVTAYQDVGLTPRTAYTYRVKAYSAVASSGYSNEASATTQGSSGSSGGGGCFIATAAYGSFLAPEVRLLRDFRDRHLMTNPLGREFVRLYYRYSPPLADYIAARPLARGAARLALAPLVFGVKYPAWAMLLMAPALLAAYFSGRKYFNGRR